MASSCSRQKASSMKSWALSEACSHSSRMASVSCTVAGRISMEVLASAKTRASLAPRAPRVSRVGCREAVWRPPGISPGSATGAAYPFGQFAAQAEHAVDGLLRAFRLGDLVDQRRADHRAFGALGHFGSMSRGADAEADAQRQIGMTAQARHRLLDVIHGRRTGAGDTRHRYVVDEAG